MENYIVGEDFNLILDRREKKGGDLVRDTPWDVVEDLIVDWDLIDIWPKKGLYT